MVRRLLALAALVPLVLAGCVSLDPEAVDTQAALAAGLAAAPSPLWHDPQNAPHPLYNWPTLSSPAVGDAVPAWWAPIEARALPAHIEGLEHVAETKGDVVRGAGIALFGSLAIVPGYGEPSKVLDITDPTAPKVLGQMEAEENHRGAIVIPYPDGRLVTAFSTGSGFDVWDITDPTAPTHVTSVETPSGGHKIAVVPGTPLVYNANSWGGTDSRVPTGNLPGQGTGQTEIYDLTDPANPVLVQEFQNGYGCHHIYFWIDAAQEKYRGLCAGIEYTQIWDVADPKAPEVIVSIPVHHGVNPVPSYSTYLNFAHYANLNDDGTVLIVGDETGGGGLPPGCDAHVATPVKELSGPFGNLWFYDVSDEKNPRLMGWISPSTVLPDTTSCTAHHGRLVPDPEGRDLIAMAFYGRGVVLVDFSDPMNPWIADSWADGADTWEAWYYNGYVFTGDLNRGLDVLTFR